LRPAARESHKAQRELLTQRRAAKPHSALLADAKRVWAQARRTDVTAAERKAHVRDLMAIVRGHVKDLVMKHDASRIIQTLVKRGGPAERDTVAAELTGQYKALAQSRYSKVRAAMRRAAGPRSHLRAQFLVSKLIRLCPAHRTSILTEFAGSVPRLLLHREAAGVLADAFELHATAAERGLLLRDFYGPEARLVSVTAGTLEDAARLRRGLAGLLDGADAERSRRILAAVKDHIVSMCVPPAARRPARLTRALDSTTRTRAR
jgi:pumilio family protein 6